MPAVTAPDLDALRRSIDEIDSRLLALIEERVRLVLSVGDYKRQHGLPIYDPERERKLIERLTAEARAPLEEVVHSPQAERQKVNHIASMAYLAQVCLDLGESTQADQLAHRAVQRCDEEGLTSHPSTSFAYIALSAVLAQRGVFAEAEAVLARGVEPHLPADVLGVFVYLPAAGGSP